MMVMMMMITASVWGKSYYRIHGTLLAYCLVHAHSMSIIIDAAIATYYLAGCGGHDLSTHGYLTSNSKCIPYLILHLKDTDGSEESKCWWIGKHHTGKVGYSLTFWEKRWSPFQELFPLFSISFFPAVSCADCLNTNDFLPVYHFSKPEIAYIYSFPTSFKSRLVACSRKVLPDGQKGCLPSPPFPQLPCSPPTIWVSSPGREETSLKFGEWDQSG